MGARRSEAVFVPVLAFDDTCAANADMVVIGVGSVVGERRFNPEVESGKAELDVGDVDSGCDGIDTEPTGLVVACEFVAGKGFGDGAIEDPPAGAGLGLELDGEFVPGLDG